MAKVDFKLTAPDRKILLPEDERTLIKAVHDNHSQRAMALLLEKHERWLYGLALPVHRRSGVDLEDLVQEARMGFMKAVEKFEFEHDVRLSTYAGWWVRAEMQMYETRNKSDVKTPLTRQGKMSKLFDAYKNLIQTRGNPPEVRAFTTEEHKKFLEETGHSIGEVAYFMHRYYGNTISLDAPLSSNPDHDVNLHNTLLDKTPSASEALEAASEVEYFRTIFAAAPLNDRERQILEQRYLTHDEDKSTLQDLANIFNVSRERIRQIEVKAMEKLSKTARAFASDFESKLLIG